MQFLLIVCIIFANSIVFAQTGKTLPPEFNNIISIELYDATFEKALNYVSKSGNIKLNYNRERIPLKQLLSIKMENVTVKAVMDRLTESTNTQMITTTEGQIIIAPKSGLPEIPPQGSIYGKIIDTDTKEPLIGANILLIGTYIGVSTDLKGEFVIDNLLPGSYIVQVSYLGYEPVIVPDIIVRSKRATVFNRELKSSVIETDEVTVRASYFTKVEDQPTSAVTMSQEEIRRTPGSAGDVSRIIMALPSVAKVNDTRNSLVVRGGSPIENGYFLDNIPIQNINHFPAQGASGGAIPLINVDFIEDVEFYTGGFSAAYGDRLSSIMDITYREGNKAEFDGQLNFDMMEFGANFEGPVTKDNGSWLFSARRSYLDLLLNSYDIEASTIPEYSDIQEKITFDISDKHKLTFVHILGIDKSVIEKKQALEIEENVYGDLYDLANTVGFNWRYLWGGRGYSNTSISHNYTDWKSKWFETVSDNKLTSNNSTENEISFRNDNHLIIDKNNTVEFGGEANLLNFGYDNFYGETVNPLGDTTMEFSVNQTYSTMKLGAYISYRRNITYRLTTTTGIRYDYFEYNDNFSFSPRFNFSYRLSRNTTLNGACGIYSQFLPMILLTQNDTFGKLKDPSSQHYVLGITHLLRDDTRLTVEIYDKEYENLPLDPSEPSLFTIDQSNQQEGFAGFTNLADNGIAYTRGIEMMVQRKLAKNFYGLVSGSYFRSRYRGFEGIWRNRSYDNRLMFTIEGGYKPNNKWEFSLRWVYAGGAPYTPFDISASQSANRGIFDSERINGERLPDYHSLNIRFDRRFHFSASNLICYFSVWNAYARENIASYYWNQVKNKPDKFRQWGILPGFGIEYEF